MNVPDARRCRAPWGNYGGIVSKAEISASSHCERSLVGEENPDL
jgi:hypothetical protein